MNETQDTGREQAGGSTGPRVSGEHIRDVSRLRRSRSDRYVAGVAGGLGRHFDIDPTVIRVVLAVLTFFGGAGLVVYVAVWLLVPEDGQDKAPIDLRSDVQRALLITAGVVALLIVFGTPFANHGWGWGFPLPLLVVGLVGLWIYTLVHHDKQPPTPWGTATTPTPEAAAAPATSYAPVQEGTAMSATETQQVSPPPPAWMPPTPQAYVPPPKPRRTGIVLFWPTLALIAIGLGILGIVDVDASVPPSAYVALTLAITAVMLIVGAFVGRPGGLIALGIVGSLGLGISSAVEASTDWQTSGETVSYTPTSTSQVLDSYSVPNGRITLDLSGVRDVAALNGRAINLHLNAGEIDVVLPRGVNADVDAELSFAGDVNVGGTESSGFNPHVTRVLPGSTNPAAPTLSLDINGRVGDIRVHRG